MSCAQWVVSVWNNNGWTLVAGLANYKGKRSRELPSETSLPDELNPFYARFEASNTEACMRASAVLDDCDHALRSRRE
jgi:hypothetical protein